MSVASQQCPPFNADISRGKGKNHLDQAKGGLGKLQFYHTVLCQEILDLNWPVCWSIVVKEKPNAASPYFREILLTASLGRRKMSMYISLSTVAFSVNYIRDLLQNIPANSGKFLKLLRILHVISSWGFVRKKKKSLTGHPAAGFPRMLLFETEFYDLCHFSDVTWQNPYPQELTRRTRLFTGNSLLLNLQNLLENILLNGKHYFKCLQNYERNFRYVLFV